MGKRCIIKERFSKSYRVKELDTKLNKQRIINECRNLHRAYKSGINTPYLLFVDILNNKIIMQYIDSSIQIKELINYIYTKGGDKTLITKLVYDMGSALAKLHNADIIHGDLTTSNMLIKIK